MLRAPLPRFLAVLITGLLLATGLQIAAEAAITRTISMSISAGSGIVKTPITFSGKLSRSPKGSVVRIQRKAGTRWITAKSTTTKTTLGNYSVPVTLPGTAGTYAFRAIAPATSTRKLAVSGSRGIKVLRRVTITATANAVLVPAGSNITISGTVKPFVPNSLVTLQKLLSGKWTNVTTATVRSNGTYAKALSVGPTTQIRALVPQLLYNAAAASPPITITTTPVIATQSLPTATRMAPYSAKLITIDGSVGTWTASPLPGGLSLNANSGVISGTPTTAQITYTQAQFTQAGTLRKSPIKTIRITVNEAPAPRIATSALPNGTRLSPYTTTLTATGNPAGTWTASPLPDGLDFDPNTGVISGTPTTVEAVDVTIGFTQTSTGLAALPVVIKLTVVQAAAPVITTTALPDGKRLSTYSFTMTAQGDPAGEWDADALPDGLSINTSTGEISGTPTVTFDGPVTIGFTQTSTGVRAAKILALKVVQADPPVISTTALTNGAVGAGYSMTLTATGDPVGVWTASPLPDGLTLDEDTGEITGNPTTLGTTQVVIGFTQTSTGVAATPKTLDLTITE